MLNTELIPAEQALEPRLMILLHGLGDSMEGYRWLPEAMQLPWMSYLLVNAPDDYYGGFSWYDIDGNSGPGVERSRKLLVELLERTAREGFAPDKTVLFGFSQGCLMSIEVGAQNPHKLAGIVGVSGYVYEPNRLAKLLSPIAAQQRFLVTHGTRDSLIPIERVRPQMEILRQAGLKIDWREFVKQHTIAGEEELSVIRHFVRESFGK